MAVKVIWQVEGSGTRRGSQRINSEKHFQITVFKHLKHRWNEWNKENVSDVP